MQSDLTRTLQTTFQQSRKFFFWAGRLHALSFWSLCSRCGRVGTVERRSYIYEIKRARGELMDMRKKLATAPGANSSEPTMIPPQIQGWLLLHRARLRDQGIVGVMTMTGGSLNFKLVEKSLLDLFTEDVLQSVDRSFGNARFLRQLKRFQRTMTTPISMRTSAKTMIRTSMRTETSLQ